MSAPSKINTENSGKASLLDIWFAMWALLIILQLPAVTHL